MNAITGSASLFNDSTTSSGISAASNPGIATVDGSKVGGWWALKANNGKIVVTPQIDTGPAAYLDQQGRHFDLSYPLGQMLGLNFDQGVFPGFTGIYLGKGAAAQAAAPGAISALGGSNADVASAQAAIAKGQSQLAGTGSGTVGTPGAAPAGGTSASSLGCAPTAAAGAMIAAAVPLLILSRRWRHAAP